MTKKRRFDRRSLSALFRSARVYLFLRKQSAKLRKSRAFVKMRILQVLARSDRDMATGGRSRVKLFAGGKDAFARLEHRIRRAKTSIFIDMFIWEDDETGRRIARLLIAAADRGVKVEISKDAVGDAFELGNDFLGTRHSRAAPWDEFWSHPSISVTHGEEHDHSKVFVFDGKILLVTGLNISDRYLHGHDYLVEIRGPRFVREYFTGVCAEDRNIRLVMNTAESQRARREVVSLLESAKRLIIVEHIFLSDPQVMEILSRKSKSGVTVALILPAKNDLHHFSNIDAVDEILSTGDPERILVYLRRDYTHAKAILVDRTRALVGSINLIESSLDRMGEMSVLVRRRPRFVLSLRLAMEHSMLHADLRRTRPRLTFFQRLLARLGM